MSIKGVSYIYQTTITDVRSSVAIIIQKYLRSVYLAGHRLTVSGIFSRLLAVGCTGKACFGLAVGCTGKARFGLAVYCIGKARFRGPIRISSRLHWAIRLGLGLGSD